MRLRKGAWLDELAIQEFLQWVDRNHRAFPDQEFIQDYSFFFDVSDSPDSINSHLALECNKKGINDPTRKDFIEILRARYDTLRTRNARSLLSLGSDDYIMSVVGKLLGLFPPNINDNWEFFCNVVTFFRDRLLRDPVIGTAYSAEVAQRKPGVVRPIVYKEFLKHLSKS